MINELKPELVLIPGMFSRDLVYGEMYDKFKVKKRKCRLIDFPAHYDFCDKVKFLLEEISKIENAYQFICHSAGAIVALKAAAIEGINPQNIFLIAPAAPYGIFHLYPSVVKSFWCVMQNPYFMTKDIVMSYRNMKKSMMNTLSDEVAKEIYKNTRSESGKFIFEVGFWFLDSKKSTYVNYQKIKCPIDIFVGTEDKVTPSKVSRNMIRRVKLIDSLDDNTSREIKLHEFLGLSHWLLKEACDEIVSWIVRA